MDCMCDESCRYTHLDFMADVLCDVKLNNTQIFKIKGKATYIQSHQIAEKPYFDYGQPDLSVTLHESQL